MFRSTFASQEGKIRRNDKEFLFKDPEEAKRFKTAMEYFLEDNYGFLFCHHTFTDQLVDLTEEELTFVEETFVCIINNII